MEQSLLLLTVATHETDELSRFIESAKFYGYDYRILGLGKEWSGGESVNGRLVFPGGGMKVNLLKEFLSTHENKGDVILFTDSYDVVFSGGPEGVMKTWDDRGLLFTAEKTCWPDTNLMSRYPKTIYDYKYLNSGGFIGKVSDLETLIESPCKDEDDDQLYYTLKFLNGEGITLDTKLEIFQTLNESTKDVNIKDGRIYNNITNTLPTVIHANGGVGPRQFLNNIYNDMNKFDSQTITLKGDEKVMVQIIFDTEHTNPSVILHSIEYLTYDKGQIDLVILNNRKRNHWEIENMIKRFEKEYNSIEYVYEEFTSTFDLRDTASLIARLSEVDYVMQVDGNYKIDNHDTIQILMKEGKEIISPILNEEQTLNSNFWCEVDDDGYFAEHDNYFRYRNYDEVGVFNVPFIKGVIMFKRIVFDEKFMIDLYRNNEEDMYGDDYYVIFCNVLRTNNRFMFLTNKRYFGKYLQ